MRIADFPLITFSARTRPSLLQLGQMIRYDTTFLSAVESMAPVRDLRLLTRSGGGLQLAAAYVHQRCYGTGSKCSGSYQPIAIRQEPPGPWLAIACSM